MKEFVPRQRFFIIFPHFSSFFIISLLIFSGTCTGGAALELSVPNPCRPLAESVRQAEVGKRRIEIDFFERFEEILSCFN